MERCVFPVPVLPISKRFLPLLGEKFSANINNMDQTVNIKFNISGNASETTANITNNINQLNAEVKGVINIFDSLGGKIVYFQQLSQSVQNFRDNFSSATRRSTPDTREVSSRGSFHSDDSYKLLEEA